MKPLTSLSSNGGNLQDDLSAVKQNLETKRESFIVNCDSYITPYMINQPSKNNVKIEYLTHTPPNTVRNVNNCDNTDQSTISSKVLDNDNNICNNNDNNDISNKNNFGQNVGQYNRNFSGKLNYDTSNEFFNLPTLPIDHTDVYGTNIEKIESKSENAELIDIKIATNFLIQNHENINSTFGNTIPVRDDNQNEIIKLNYIHEEIPERAHIAKTIITPTRFTYPQRALSTNLGSNILDSSKIIPRSSTHIFEGGTGTSNTRNSSHVEMTDGTISTTVPILDTSKITNLSVDLEHNFSNYDRPINQNQNQNQNQKQEEIMISGDPKASPSVQLLPTIVTIVENDLNSEESLYLRRPNMRKINSRTHIV